MDPDASDAEAEEQAMAEALGFSSFGGQDRPQKKRKYNPHADAAVVAGSGQVEEFSTGSNSTPLGFPTARPGAVGGNADELDLGDDEEDGQGSVPQGAERGDASSDSAQVRSSSLLPPGPAGLPQRPAPGQDSRGPTSHGGGRPGRGALANNGTLGEWYEGYYDHTSNENPWERLEKSLGLQSKGTWVPRNAGPSAAPS